MSASTECFAVNYGPCGGHLNTREVKWHCRPRAKDLCRGHGAYDETTNVVLCASHEKQIKEKNENNMLPELYGWDLKDALDGLVCDLTHTSYELLNRNCDHCLCRQKTMGTETGACSYVCQSLGKMGADWDYCHCSKPVTCICPTLQNNALHWAVFTYVNGFQYMGEYDCDACLRPSWRDSHEEYKSGLVPIKTIMELANKHPNMILERNIQNQTPLTMIQPMIELLTEEANGDYVKCAEMGWANSNISKLKEIKNGFIEILDAYAN
jgi:hypothetical protein